MNSPESGGVGGTTADRFDNVRQAFLEEIRSGREVGAGLCVDVDGEIVVDLWGGHRDLDGTEPWTSDTIVNVWSTTKLVTALAALLLADRGLLALDRPVAAYWPEFAQAGKREVAVRHLLGHTSGLPAWNKPVRIEDLYDWDESVARLAAQEPWWPPGTAGGYHGKSLGHLVGEVVKRITGVSLRDFVRTEVAAFVGADFQIGASEHDWPRIADIIPPPAPTIHLGHPEDSVVARASTGPLYDASCANTPSWRAADLGALNGHGTARSVVLMLRQVTLARELPASGLISASTVEKIFQTQANGPDLVLGGPIHRGVGFAIPRPGFADFIRGGRVGYWGGWGGSLGIVDLDRRMTFSYVMNKMEPVAIGNERSIRYLTDCYQALDRPPLTPHL